MAAEKEVLKEFLVALGFQIDQPSARKFVDYLGGLSKTAAKVGATVLGVAVAAEAMVQRVAGSMEKLYYASQRTGATAKSIAALQFGFKQIGLTADDAMESLDAMSKALRINPGTESIFNMLGIKTQGRDRVEVLLDLVTQLSKLPDYLGVRWAEELGISADTFIRMKDNLQGLTAAVQKHRDLQRLSGVDTDKVTKQYRDYMNSIGEVWEKTELLSKQLATKMLPFFKDLIGVVNEVMEDFIKFGALEINFDDMDPALKGVLDALLAIGTALKDLAESELAKNAFKVIKQEAIAALGVLGGVAETISLMAKGKWVQAGEKHVETVRKGLNDAIGGVADMVMRAPGAEGGTRGERNTSKPIGGLAAPGKGAPAGTGSGLFDMLERAHGLPKGLLDSMWVQESGRGRNMEGASGEKGQFQWMPAMLRARPHDPYDLTQGATFTAQHLGELSQKYGGDIDKMLAAYNWGETKLDKYGLGAEPSSTRKYAADIKGRLGEQGTQVTMNHETTINVQGGEAAATGRAVAGEQSRVYAEAVRNAKGAIN